MIAAGTARRLRVPGDKSISHRALICAALASGRSRVGGVLRSADVHSTAGVLRSLGIAIPELADDLRITGRGLRGLQPPAGPLDCGNSGTTTRLMAGVLAGHPFASRFVGDASLSRRPMGRIARPLAAMGARIDFEAGQHLPMILSGGRLAPVTWENTTGSAQVKSAILFAALVGGVDAEVGERVRSRDHTERILRSLGVEISVRAAGVAISPAPELAPFQLEVPGDPSSGAFFAALAAADDSAGAQPLELVDIALNSTRLGFYRVLREMGASVAFEVEREEGGEPVGTIRIAPRELRGVCIGGAQVPSMIDELPMLACLATRAHGETEIRGAAELRVKESDRIAAVVSNLRAIGADADELPDGLVVSGSAKPLVGEVRSHGDHRLAMAFGVLGSLPGNAITVDDPACVDVSYPGFWGDLSAMAS